MGKQALIFGATGAVGRELLTLCLTDDRYALVTVIARRAAPLKHRKLRWIEQGFDALDSLAAEDGMENGDAFCCLGTTLKAAGSQASFRRVDFDFVLSAARYAKRSGVRQFLMVSSLGANPGSNNFYLRTKGEIESAVAAEGFANLQVFRPSLLVGKRDEFRLAESVGRWVSFLLTPFFYLGFRNYQPVEIAVLAKALYLSAEGSGSNESHTVVENAQIQRY